MWTFLKDYTERSSMWQIQPTPKIQPYYRIAQWPLQSTCVAHGSICPWWTTSTSLQRKVLPAFDRDRFDRSQPWWHTPPESVEEDVGSSMLGSPGTPLAVSANSSWEAEVRWQKDPRPANCSTTPYRLTPHRRGATLHRVFDKWPQQQLPWLALEIHGLLPWSNTPFFIVFLWAKSWWFAGDAHGVTCELPTSGAWWWLHGPELRNEVGQNPGRHGQGAERKFELLADLNGLFWKDNSYRCLCVCLDACTYEYIRQREREHIFAHMCRLGVYIYICVCVCVHVCPQHWVVYLTKTTEQLKQLRDANVGRSLRICWFQAIKKSCQNDASSFGTQFVWTISDPSQLLGWKISSVFATTNQLIRKKTRPLVEHQGSLSSAPTSPGAQAKGNVSISWTWGVYLQFMVWICFNALIEWIFMAVYGWTTEGMDEWVNEWMSQRASEWNQAEVKMIHLRGLSPRLMPRDHSKGHKMFRSTRSPIPNCFSRILEDARLKLGSPGVSWVISCGLQMGRHEAPAASTTERNCWGKKQVTSQEAKVICGWTKMPSIEINCSRW